jgi:hypothetical protein
MATLTEFAPVIQTAVGPVVLVSGAGLLLLSMTNRLGRVVDRSRTLSREIEEHPEKDSAIAVAQLHILYRRARLIRNAIALAATSVLFAGLLVIALFVSSLTKTVEQWLISGLFIACMLLLIGSIVEFLRDINLALVAVRLEIGDKWSR